MRRKAQREEAESMEHRERAESKAVIHQKDLKADRIRSF
jgi:hypothetical protein